MSGISYELSAKACRGCGVEKELSAFYKHPQMADGYLNYKVCRRAYQKNRPPEAIAEIERRRNQKTARKAHLARNLKKWRRENPSKAAVQRNRNRAMRLECEGHYTAAEFKALCEEYGNVCLRCGDRDTPLTPDHVIPLSLCRRCNSRKNIKVIDYRPGGISLG